MIKRFNYNWDINKYHPSYGTFDVLVLWESDERWISVPYELLVQFLLETDPELTNYLTNNKIEGDFEILLELKSLDYDFKNTVQNYLDAHYLNPTFHNLPQYQPE